MVPNMDSVATWLDSWPGRMKITKTEKNGGSNLKHANIAAASRLHEVSPRPAASVLLARGAGLGRKHIALGSVARDTWKYMCLHIAIYLFITYRDTYITCVCIYICACCSVHAILYIHAYYTYAPTYLHEAELQLRGAMMYACGRRQGQASGFRAAAKATQNFCTFCRGLGFLVRIPRWGPSRVPLTAV